MIVACAKCWTNNTAGSSLCTNCGSELSNYSKQESEAVAYMLKHDVLALANEYHELFSMYNSNWKERTINLIDEDTKEEKVIYQWYIITPWLGKKLKSLGYVVLETNDNFMWGRTCGGQGIAEDGMLQEVFKHDYYKKAL